MSKKRQGGIVRASEREERAKSWSFEHPLGTNSEVHGRMLSDACGMERIGVHLMRIPPGKENFVFHAHNVEEEFYFIVSGRGIAEIGDEEHEIGPGDFLGFGTPSLGHQLKNPFDEDLVYLVGGERRGVEVAEFPRLKKRIIRVGREAQVVDDSQLMPFWKGEEE